MERSKLKLKYDDFWNSSMLLFKKNIYVYDPILNNQFDERRGISLIFKLTGTVLNEIERFLAEGKKLEPDQYYYNLSELHVTILSIISCDKDFKLSQINISDYINLIKRALVGIKGFSIRLKGISASPSCILLQGFPQDNSLSKMRNNLRHLFQESSLKHSIDKRYSIQTAHTTMIRFKKELSNSSNFLDFLNKYRNWNFGRSRIKEIELVFNDWYHKSSFVEVLNVYKI